MKVYVPERQNMTIETSVETELIGQDTSERGYDNLRCHMTIVKWIGIILIVSTCTSTVFVLVGMSISRHSKSSEVDCVIKLEEESQRPNVSETACVYVKQYNLRENTYVTVCNREGEVFIDIRRFLNGTATILGIPLSLHQWLTLKQVTPLIDRAITEARTYWKTLQSL